MTISIENDDRFKMLNLLQETIYNKIFGKAGVFHNKSFSRDDFMVCSIKIFDMPVFAKLMNCPINVATKPGDIIKNIFYLVALYNELPNNAQFPIHNCTLGDIIIDLCGSGLAKLPNAYFSYNMFGLENNMPDTYNDYLNYKKLIEL